ncbi:hypothetical protein V8E54_009110 [Elaphomyces granulatus]
MPVVWRVNAHLQKSDDKFSGSIGVSIEDLVTQFFGGQAERERLQIHITDEKSNYLSRNLKELYLRVAFPKPRPGLCSSFFPCADSGKFDGSPLTLFRSKPISTGSSNIDRGWTLISHIPIRDQVSIKTSKYDLYTGSNGDIAEARTKSAPHPRLLNANFSRVNQITIHRQLNSASQIKVIQMFRSALRPSGELFARRGVAYQIESNRIEIILSGVGFALYSNFHLFNISPLRHFEHESWPLGDSRRGSARGGHDPGRSTGDRKECAPRHQER